jgi:AcrR family transcriptional regulator
MPTDGNGSGRAAQRARTRKAILRAAGRLLERGERPDFDEIAAEAEVSRATAYRYFPGLDALLSEAAVDALVPEPEEVFGPDTPTDPTARVMMVDDVFDRACREREVPLRLMLARVLERSALQPEGSEPLRQNRRVPMLRQALAPLGDRMDPERRELLIHALAVIIGTESMIALKDVVGLDAHQSHEVRRWAIDALLKSALSE